MKITNLLIEFQMNNFSCYVNPGTFSNSAKLWQKIILPNSNSGRGNCNLSYYRMLSWTQSWLEPANNLMSLHISLCNMTRVLLVPYWSDKEQNWKNPLVCLPWCLLLKQEKLLTFSSVNDWNYHIFHHAGQVKNSKMFLLCYGLKMHHAQWKLCGPDISWYNTLVLYNFIHRHFCAFLWHNF